MIPLASVLFSFTNTGKAQLPDVQTGAKENEWLTDSSVGAALWAADIEAKENQMARSTAPELRDAAKKAE